MTSRNSTAWFDELLDNLGRSGPEGAAALGYVRRHHTGLGMRDQPTGARWTAGRRIELHPRFVEGSPADPHALGLVIHEVRHLQQGPAIALSVYGELEAWQLQFSFLESTTGHYHADPRRSAILEQLMSLPLNWDRRVLEDARAIMRAYAGKAYRIDLLPLYPLPAEILFRLTGRQPAPRKVAYS